MPWPNKILAQRITKDYADGKLIVPPPNDMQLLWLDERGQTGAEIFAGIGAAVGAILKFMDHPITAYLVVLAVIGSDTGVAIALGLQGATGFVFQLLVNNLFGINIEIYSWEVLILFAFLPLIFYAIKSLAMLIYRH